MNYTAKNKILLHGPAGIIEIALDVPDHPRGIALIAHPHPLYGGTLDNKVVQTLAKVFVEMGYNAARPNFRGVGKSEGEHDYGQGETQDLLWVVNYLREQYGNLPLVLSGFSFGAAVQAKVAQQISTQRLVLVGIAVNRLEVPRVPADSLLIHGELDDTVPLADVLNWARPQELPIVVVPGADHFFHQRLHIIKNIVRNGWKY